MNTDDAFAIGRLDAHAQAALVASGQLAPGALVEAAIQRLDVLDARLGVLCHRAFDEARRMPATAPDARFPLAGVPWLAKDSLSVPGMPTRGGSRSRGDAPARVAPPFVQRLAAQGLVALGKSAMPEFGLICSTEPLRGPVTRNPWNPAHSAGGSSGGAAAAVAAGLVPLAHGSDGAGSIRMPAACCGVVGLKPSRGATLRVRNRHVLEDLIVSDILLSRSVRDSAWAFAATARAPQPALGALPRLRIGVLAPNWQLRDPDPAVAPVLDDTAALCARLGHTVQTCDWPLDAPAFAEDYMGLWALLAREIVDHSDAVLGPEHSARCLEPWTLGLAEWSAGHEVERLEAGVQRLASLPARVRDWHARFDVVLSPVVRTPPPRLGEHAPDRDFSELLPAVMDWMAYTPLQNAAGSCAISLPLAQSPDGLPIGLQFAADRGGDMLLLALAAELERAAPWSERWPPISVAQPPN